MEPEDLAVIGHIGDLLADIYTVKYGAYLHFTAVLNDGSKGAQSRRNDCLIRTVEVLNLGRNTYQPFVNYLVTTYFISLMQCIHKRSVIRYLPF